MEGEALLGADAGASSPSGSPGARRAAVFVTACVGVLATLALGLSSDGLGAFGGVTSPATMWRALGAASPRAATRPGPAGDGAGSANAPGSRAAIPSVDPLVTFNTPSCRETRAALAKATNHDGDVVVIPEIKAVYVDIVKAASESIRSTLQESFHASWSQDYGQFAHPVLGRPQRSTTSYLSDDVIANYTFFTFVRDPNTRFRSSYAQAICRERCTLCAVRGKEKMYTPTIPEITSFLQGRLMHFYRDLTLKGRRADEISLQEAWVDEHFESQILRLSGATRDGAPVPINFIGRVENLEHDWARLMDHLGVKEGDPRRAAPGTKEHPCDIPARGAVVARERASQVTTQEKVAVASLYHDDFVCLGYHKPQI